MAQFDIRIRENLSYILERFNSRWLLSIIETYADRDWEPRIRYLCLAVSVMFCWERFALTGMEPKKELHTQANAPLYDGFTKINNADNADTHLNLFRRLRVALSPHKVPYAITRELVLRNLEENSTVLSALDNKHPAKIKASIRKVFLEKKGA